jgi:hypothetical protein
MFDLIFDLIKNDDIRNKLEDVMLSESQFLQAHKGTPKVEIATDEEKVLLAAIEWLRR